MILLFLDHRSGVLEAYKRNPIKYRVDGALKQVDEQRGVADRLRRLLGFDQTRWRAFMEISRHYHGFSHAGAVSTIFHFPLDPPRRVIIGAHYDPAKRNATRLELRRRRTALKTLDTLVRILFHVFPRAPRTKPTKTSARRPEPVGAPPPRIGLAAIRARPAGGPTCAGDRENAMTSWARGIHSRNATRICPLNIRSSISIAAPTPVPYLSHDGIREEMIAPFGTREGALLRPVTMSFMV